MKPLTSLYKWLIRQKWMWYSYQDKGMVVYFHLPTLTQYEVYAFFDRGVDAVIGDLTKDL